jgi:hypothetical protein
VADLSSIEAGKSALAEAVSDGWSAGDGSMTVAASWKSSHEVTSVFSGSQFQEIKFILHVIV